MNTIDKLAPLLLVAASGLIAYEFLEIREQTQAELAEIRNSEQWRACTRARYFGGDSPACLDDGWN